MTDQIRVSWTADTILDFLYTHRHTLRAMGVKQIGLFGSYARGDQQPGSDMDFLFTVENLTFSTWMDVWNFLEDSFNVEVDLVPEKDLRAELRPRVLAEVQYVAGL